MDINIKGNPGTGNTFQEINISTVQNFNPNATTVVNYNYADKPKPVPVTDKPLQNVEREHRKAQILEYVGRLRPYVAKEWQNRYETLWREILGLPEVDAVAYEPGKQKNTTFNRNLIAHIIYIMCQEDIVKERNATTLTVALEGDKDHSVRAKLGEYPADSHITGKILALLG